jgi:hypothetical protein
VTISNIKNTVAGYLGKTVADLTVNGEDLALSAMNQVRQQAEMLHDFNFQRKLLTLTVDTVTGGSLDNAVIYGTSTGVTVKTILDIGQFDEWGNLRPQSWTTVEDSLNSQRVEYPYGGIRYPTDGEFAAGIGGPRRFTIANDSLFVFPKTETAEILTVGLEAYVFSNDWTASSDTVTVTGATGVTGVNTTYYPHGTYNGYKLYISLSENSNPGTLYFLWHTGANWVINTLVGTSGANYRYLTSTSQSPAGDYVGVGSYTGTGTAVLTNTDTTSDIWLTKGSAYIQWATIVYLNNLCKEFVPRQEGNLPPPQTLADTALATFITWDIYKYEGFRRHE